jgi:hypothetical protein
MASTSSPPTTRQTGPGAISVAQMEHRRSAAHRNVRATPVRANCGCPSSHGVIAGTG